MKLSTLQGFKPVNYLSKNNQNSNMMIANNLSPLKTDTVSFKGDCPEININTNLKDINANEFPDDLYLNLDDVYKTFEEQRSYHRWEKFPFTLGKLLAKRMDYLGLTECGHSGSYGSDSNSVEFSIWELDKVKNADKYKDEKIKDYSVDWTKEYKELETFFSGENGLGFYGAEDSMDKIKAGLPEILKKQGWIK